MDVRRIDIYFPLFFVVILLVLLNSFLEAYGSQDSLVDSRSFVIDRHCSDNRSLLLHYVNYSSFFSINVKKLLLNS